MNLLTKIILDLDVAYRTSPWTDDYKRLIVSAVLNLREFANELERDSVGKCRAIDAAKDAIFLANIREK